MQINMEVGSVDLDSEIDQLRAGVGRLKEVRGRRGTRSGQCGQKSVYICTCVGEFCELQVQHCLSVLWPWVL